MMSFCRRVFELVFDCCGSAIVAILSVCECQALYILGTNEHSGTSFYGHLRSLVPHHLGHHYSFPNEFPL